MIRQATVSPPALSCPPGQVDVSLIIVTFNARSITFDTLRSYRDAIAADTAHGYQIIVVDNASSSDLPAAIQSEFSDVRLIRNRENLGYARACNIGFQQSSGRYVLFSNPDREINRKTLPGLISYMDEHPRTGACTPRLQLMGRPDIEWGCHRGLPTP